MAKKGKKSRNTGRLNDEQYLQIIRSSRTQVEERLQQLGLWLDNLRGKSDMRRLNTVRSRVTELSAQAASIRNLSIPDSSHFTEKERVIAYYARPDVQREMYRYAKGRYLTVLRNFRPMFSALHSADDVLPLMFHYLKSNRWPSMHGTILRYNEERRKICDFVFEPDFKKNWSVAFGAARPIVQLFIKMGLPFFIKFSGNTSPHIIVPGEALATAGEEEINRNDFREQVYSFVRNHMSKPGLLDGPNWKPEHFLRLAYSIHELGGRVSMPIKPEEFDSFNPSKAQIENVAVIENWWHIPEDAAERGKVFVQQVMKSYPKLVRGTDKFKSIHKWKPPEIPRKLRQIVDANRYEKMLQDGRRLLAAATEDVARSEPKAVEETLSNAMVEVLAMLKRWEDAGPAASLRSSAGLEQSEGMKIDLKAAAAVCEVDIEELKGRYRNQVFSKRNQVFSKNLVSECKTWFLDSEIQEVFYHYANGRRFRIADSEAHFRLQQPSDIPLLWAHFKSLEKNLPSSEAKGWSGLKCTRAKYNLIDNTISACDIAMEIDFSRSDYTSAVELAQTLIAVLKKHQIFCYLKFNGDEILELTIPAEALPQQIDGQATAFKMHQITSGLNRGFRKMPEVSGNDCCLIITPYGYTRPAYSLNPKTGLACVILMPEKLQDFSPECANPALVCINKDCFNVPAEAPLQTQRFLKYALSPNWQPV